MRYVDPTGELAGLILAVRIVSVVVGIVGGILSGFATARRLADRRGGANGWTIFGGIVVGLTIAGIGAVGVWQAPAIAGFLYGAWQWVLGGIAAVLFVVFGIGADPPGGGGSAQYRFALRIGGNWFQDQWGNWDFSWDYHFMVESRSHGWVHKQGWFLAAEEIGFVRPSQINWYMDGIPFYDSDTIYFRATLR